MCAFFLLFPFSFYQGRLTREMHLHAQATKGGSFRAGLTLGRFDKTLHHHCEKGPYAKLAALNLANLGFCDFGFYDVL